MAILVRLERDIDPNSRRQESRMRMLRASALLVLYNAIEASARSGIEAIYDEIAGSNISFDDLRENLRIRVLRDFRSNVGADSYAQVREIAIDIVSRSFDATKVFSGNVDARALRAQAEDYGFACTTDFARTRDGADLLAVKNNRNNLAHGVRSFTEVGRDYLIGDIRAIAQHSMAYMEQILLNIDRYLDAREYLQNEAA
jgi:hypothetical protein